MAKKNPKILVVDDEPDITASFQSFFGRRGFSVSTTASGKDALEIIKTSKPDLVFLDLTLEELNGKEVLKTLREYDKKTKVVIVTGHTLDSENEEKEFNLLGISAYLNKPLIIDDLVTIVESILGDKFSPKDFEKYKYVRREERPISSVVHKLRNLLGNIRNKCEVYLLNKKDGIYNNKSQEELSTISDEIIENAMKTVDQAIEVLDGIKEKK